MPVTTRLFVGNVPSNITDSCLAAEFNHYGLVKDVELKQKKVTDGESNSHFAFITIETNDKVDVHKCIEEFSKEQWKGTYLNVTVARESFMEKLKREREEEERKKKNQNQITYQSDCQNLSATNAKSELPAFKFTPKPFTNGNQTSEIVNGGSPKYSKNKLESSETRHVQDNNYSDDFNESNQNGFMTESNELFRNDGVEVHHDYAVKKKTKKKFSEPISPYVKQKLKIASVIPQLEPAKSQDVKKLTAADEKRLKSIQNMRAAYNEKKSLIKIALSSVDKKVNKIIFDDEGSAIIPTDVAALKADSNDSKIVKKQKRKHDESAEEKYTPVSSNKKSKKALFDDEDSGGEDDDINFNIKEQFQGEAGQKLLQLQARFQSDKRFTMDERFMEEAGNPDGNLATEDNVDGVEVDERTQQMAILQSVLKQSVNTTKKTLPNKTMLRFDPSRPDHDKFMTKPLEDGLVKKSKAEKKRDKLRAIEESAKAEQKPVPEVSQERYYKVNESLKQTMEEQEPFSLLSLFGNREPEDDTKPEYSTVPLKNTGDKIKNPLTDSNPFEYDSSDNEETYEGKDTQKDVNESPYGVAERKVLLVTENFFFSKNDPRFNEGLEFFMNVKPRSENRSRQELKSLVKKRIQNKMRNERTNLKKVQQRKSSKATKFTKR